MDNRKTMDCCKFCCFFNCFFYAGNKNSAYIHHQINEVFIENPMNDGMVNILIKGGEMCVMNRMDDHQSLLMNWCSS